MDYRFIKINDDMVILFGYRGGINLVRSLRGGELSVGVYELILLIRPYLDDGLTVIIHDIEENKFIRIDERKLEIF